MSRHGPLIQYCSGGTLFCTILFFCSFKFCIPGCYPRWCGVSAGLLSLFPLWWGVGCGSCWGVLMSLALIDGRFVGDAWCVMWHINLYPGRKKKLPCFALSVPWRSIAHLAAWAGKKGRKTPDSNQRVFVIYFSGWSVSPTVDGESGDLFVFVPCHPVLTVNRSDSRRSS